MHRVFATLCLILLAATLLAAEAGDMLWVTAEGARLQSDRSVDASTLEVVPVGSEVSILLKEGRWYQIQTLEGKTGWMYQGRLSETKPLAETEGGTSDLFGTLTGSQITAQKADTSRSIRGLSPETESYAQNQHTPEKYRQALEEVLLRAVGAQELSSFLRQGRVGEYAQ